MLIGVKLPDLDTASPRTSVASRDIYCNRLAYFSFVLAAVIPYSIVAADFFVYLPDIIPSWHTTTGSISGLWLSSILLVVIGVLLGEITLQSPIHLQAYQQSPSNLIVVAFAPIGPFGKFCCAVLSLGTLAAASARINSLALAGQATIFSKVGRLYWTVGGGIIALVCAVAGKDSLIATMQNFIGFVGYWVAAWLGVFVVEHFAFRKGQYEWDAWQRRDLLPCGFVASGAVIIGFGAAILCIAQT